MKKLTMKDIARAAGVSPATVSLALRNITRVNKVTAERVRAIAKKMGYRPDPALSALVAYRAQTRPKGDYGKIAVLHAFSREWPDFNVSLKQMVEGIIDQAGRYGYDIELFRVAADRAQNQELSRMLYFRGVRGVIVTPIPYAKLSLDWNRFSAVAMGEYFSQPQLNRIAPDHDWFLRMTYQRLRALGYRKIGYCNARVSEERKHQLYLGAYLKSLYLDGIEFADSPPLYYEEDEEWNPVPWLDRHGFDAVMVMVPHYFIQRLRGSRYAVPKRLGVAGFTLPSEGENEDVAGYVVNETRMGAAAVDILQPMLLKGKLGVPDEDEHCNTLIRGHWRMAGSVRRLAR